MSPDQEVVDALSEVGDIGLPLADWYMSVFSFVNCASTPDRFAQSAQSARELIEKVSEVVVEPHQTQTDAYTELTKLIASFRTAKDKSGSFQNGQWVGPVDSYLSEFLVELDRIADSKKPTGRSRRDLAIKAFQIFQGLVPGRNHPSDEHVKSFGTKWRDLYDYFNLVSKHKKTGVDDESFSAKVGELTEFLKTFVIKVPFEKEQLLDSIISEGESSD